MKTEVWCATMKREYVSLAQPDHHLVLFAKQHLGRLCDCSVYENVANTQRKGATESLQVG